MTLRTRGIAVKQTIKPAEVMVDATLLSALLDTMLDWSLRHACTSVDLRLDTEGLADACPACLPIRPHAAGIESRAAPTRGAAHPLRVAELDCLVVAAADAAGPHDGIAPQSRGHRKRHHVDAWNSLHTVNDSLEGAAVD